MGVNVKKSASFSLIQQHQTKENVSMYSGFIKTESIYFVKEENLFLPKECLD